MYLDKYNNIWMFTIQRKETNTLLEKQLTITDKELIQLP